MLDKFEKGDEVRSSGGRKATAVTKKKTWGKVSEMVGV